MPHFEDRAEALSDIARSYSISQSNDFEADGMTLVVERHCK
jgi:hypothetical protein